MALKLSLDQMSAWILAVVATGAVFGGGYAVSKISAARSGNTSDEQGDGEGVHGSEGEAAEGGEHGAKEEEHGAKGEEHEEHGAKGEEHEEHGAKGEEHGAKGEEHGAKGEEHGESEAAPKSHSEHGAEPAEAREEPSAHGGHSESHAEQGAPAGGHKSLAAHAAPHWEYKGSSGPDHWGELASQYKTCSTGRHQSPVDISSPATNGKLLPIKFHYQESDTVVTNDGHTVQVEIPSGNYAEIDGERYDLVHIQFHAPSEHKVENAPYDLEMHLTHKSAEGRLAVIAILFQEGAANKALTRLWQNLPGIGEKAPEPIALDPTKLLPTRRLYYHYEGSLTSPPCSEGVAWYVLTEPEDISAKQVDQFVHAVPYNARPVQALHGRKVVKSAR